MRVGNSSELLLEMIYQRRWFDGDRVAGLLSHLGAVLEKMAEGFDIPLRDLPMLTESEREQLRVEWNRTGEEYGGGETVQEMFEEQELNEGPIARRIAGEIQDHRDAGLQ